MVADDAQMETAPPPVRPKRKRISLKKFKNLKAHLGLNLGAALVPEISFAAVPNHPKPVLTNSRIAKAVFSATWAGQNILCTANLQDNNPNTDESEEPGYETIPKISNTIEEDVYELANESVHLDNYTANVRDDKKKSSDNYNANTEVKTIVPDRNRSSEPIYSVPNKPVKVNISNASLHQIQNQVDCLETLKLMKSKKSESTVEIRKLKNQARKEWQSESNVTSETPLVIESTEYEVKRAIHSETASQRVQFMENLHKKLETLRREVLETVEENKHYQKQKLLWAEKLSEANQILEENMILKQDIRHLEQTVDESRLEVHQLKRELLTLREVTGQANTQSNDLIEENSRLRQKCHKFQLEKENSMLIHQHNFIINEIKMLLESLKLKHEQEVDHLYSQLRNAQHDSSQMKVELMKHKEQATQFKSDNAALNTGLQDTLQKCQELLTQLKASHQWGETAQDLLSTLIHVAEHTTEERDELAEHVGLDSKSASILRNTCSTFQSRAQSNLHQKFVSVLLKRTVSLGRLQESLKCFKTRAIERLQKLEEIVEVNEAESVLTQNSLEMEIEILKAALQERDEKLKMLISSKKELEKELDTLWTEEAKQNASRKSSDC